jgi:hypothetical protein
MLRRAALVIASMLVVAGLTLPNGAQAAEFPCTAENCTPPADSTVTNPVIDCNEPVLTEAAELDAGIIIQNSNITIINPEIRECQSGVLVRKNPTTGAVPNNIRIIADSTKPGYLDTNITFSRAGVKIKRVTNLEVGDVSAPASQIGGEFEIIDNYHPFHGEGGLGARIHHVKTYCAPNCSGPWISQNIYGAHWGIKWLADRNLPGGAPFEASQIEIDHNIVSDFTDEGIDFDSRGNDPNQTAFGAGSVTVKTNATKRKLTIPGIPTSESTVGMFVIFNDGAAQGHSLKIQSRSSNVFTMASTEQWSQIAVGNRVTVGMRFFHNYIHHNTITALASGSKNGTSFHGSTLFSRIEANTVNGLFTYNYPSPFHVRLVSGDPVSQCIHVKSMAGPGGLPKFSFQNSVVGNICNASGDVSSTVISWGTYEVDSPTWMNGNVVQAGFQTEWRYKSSEPPADPWVP